MNQSGIIKLIIKELKENSDEKRKESIGNFFKEKIINYGVKAPIVKKIGKKYFKEISSYGKDEIFKLCDELWQSGYIEESFIACNWSYYIHKDYKPNDFKVFEHWVDNYITNWASCDTLCNHTIGEFLEMYPQYASKLKVWAKSKNRWKRRAAAVSFIIPARKGKFSKEIFEIADILLLDDDDLVQKGYGWMLKALSEYYQKDVWEFVMDKKKIMPRTALRYAIEKMPKDLKEKGMKK